jgi:adenylate cyclase class IV
MSSAKPAPSNSPNSMLVEIEAKFLNVNHDNLRTKLRESGAKLLEPMKFMRRRNFDFPDKRLDAEQAWVRLRDEGNKIELMIKQKVGEQLGDIRETAVEVTDFHAATEFLLRLGMYQKTEQESKRELWKLGEVDIMLDEWPWAKPFAEIEGPTPEQVESVANILGFDWSEAIFDTVEPVYYAEYDVAREQIHAVQMFRFDEPVPETFIQKAQ